MIYCNNCGTQLDGAVGFCPNCGAPVSAGLPAAPGPGSAGYSRLIDADEVRKALKKNKRIGNIAVFVFVLLPFIGFVIYGAVSDKMDIGKAAVYGLILTGIFAFVSVIVALKHKLTKPFEGVVADKKITHRAMTADSRSGRSRTKYTVRIECEDGKRRKKEVSIPVYEYLQIGDRVRYLPQFPQPFEKYDKRADGAVLCMFCSKKNPLSETHCKFCHNLLIK